MPNQWVACSYESYIVFCVAKPLMGNLPSAHCRKVSVQQLLRCRILLFVYPVSCRRSGFAAGCTVLPRKALLPAASQGKGQVL